MPIAREVTTNWPYLPGSSTKGVLRDGASKEVDAATIKTAFGPGWDDNASDNAGALLFTDAHILCLPVRSLVGTFAWVSCPLALHRWRRDVTSAGLQAAPALGFTVKTDEIVVGDGDSAILDGDRVYLEDLDLTAATDAMVGTVGGEIARAAFEGDQEWQQFFVQRFGIVTDDLFTFLTETATDVRARVRLDENTKTTVQGALWYEEAVPAETIFSAPVLLAERWADKADSLFAVLEPSRQGFVQIGGGASVGRGVVSLAVTS